MVKERIFSFLPKFEMYIGENYVGCIQKEFSFFRPVYNIDCNGWHIEGNFFEWDYSILDPVRGCVASVTKELLNWTDTYTITVSDPRDALHALMLVIAIDAEKSSRDK